MGRENETALLTKSMKCGNLKPDSEFINKRKEETLSYYSKKEF